MNAKNLDNFQIFYCFIHLNHCMKSNKIYEDRKRFSRFFTKQCECEEINNFKKIKTQT